MSTGVAHRSCGFGLAVCLLAGAAFAQQPPAGPASSRESRSVQEWLTRVHEASRRRAYSGTFVVSSSGSMSSARILHVCDGEQQIERVESLSGPQRLTFRNNDQVTTFLPEVKLVRTDRRESLGSFPGLLASGDYPIADFYLLRPLRLLAPERVAGYDTDVVLLEPRDSLRYGYRIWSERRTGLVVKLQTLEIDGNVIEQAAFSELQLDASLKVAQLAQQMSRTDGYRVEKLNAEKTTPAAEGWALKASVPGFKSSTCYRRGPRMLQCVFSDGLASVSLFMEPFDAPRHQQESTMALGATQTLTRRIGDWWLTAVGEVPAQTLQAFVQNLERRK